MTDPRTYGGYTPDALLALANAATKGPWDCETHDEPAWMIGPDPRHVRIVAVTAQGNDEANATFIATARAAVPALIERIEELEREGHWVACKEKMPEHASIVFVWDDGWQASYVAQRTEDGWEPGNHEPPINITHWMSFPENPAKDELAREKEATDAK